MKQKLKKIITFLVIFSSLWDYCPAVALDYVVDFSVPANYTSSSATQAYINNSLAQLSEQLNHKWKINSTTTYSWAYDVIVEGNYAYMTNYLRDSVSIVNISNPASPTFVSEIINNAGTIRLDGAAGIVKDGNYLYVASTVSDALQIINVTNPAVPTPAGQILNSPTTRRLNGARGIEKSGNYVYITSDVDDAVVVIDVTTPTAPVWRVALQNTTTLNGARDIKIVGTYAYIAAYDGDRLTIVNISNPLAPTVTWNVTDATNLNGAHHVEVSWNYAYVSAYLNASVRVIDISTPSLPVAVINISWWSYSLTNPRDLQIDWNKLFISSYGNDAINIADISVPTTPVFVNKIVHNAANPLLDGADWIFKVWNLLYVSSYLSCALEILEISIPYPTVPYITTNINTTYLWALYNMIERVWPNNVWNMSYQISKDWGINYYYWNNNNWIIWNAWDYSQTNDIATIQGNILSFNNVISGNSFRLRAYLESNGTEKSELDDVTILSDNTAPSISSFFPSTDQIIPKWDFDIFINHSDGESWIDTNSNNLTLYKWDWVSDWWWDIEGTYINQLWSSTTSTWSIYPVHNLPYGKYKASYVIKDMVWNTTTQESIFYVDEISWNISRANLDISEINPFTHSFSNDEFIVTVETIWAWFSVYLKTNNPLENLDGNIINSWDWTSGFWYDLFPYIWNIKKINNSELIATQNKLLNINGMKNTYTYKIKLWAYTNYSNPSWAYNWEVWFVFSSQYQ